MPQNTKKASVAKTPTTPVNTGKTSKNKEI